MSHRDAGRRRFHRISGAVAVPLEKEGPICEVAQLYSEKRGDFEMNSPYEEILMRMGLLAGRCRNALGRDDGGAEEQVGPPRLHVTDSKIRH